MSSIRSLITLILISLFVFTGCTGCGVHGPQSTDTGKQSNNASQKNTEQEPPGPGGTPMK